MTKDWLLPLITGVVGLLGALIGTGGAICPSRRPERAQRETERLAALIDFYAVVNQLGMLWSAFAEVGIGRTGWLEELRAGVRISGLKKQIIDRFFFVTDRSWHASARARAFASPAELEVIDSVDEVVVAWETGKPMPDEWGPRVRRLRDLIQGSATVT